jgi:hypothetical protein
LELEREWGLRPQARGETPSTPKNYLQFINLAAVVATDALTLNPSPKMGEGLSIRLPFSSDGRRGWGMRAVQNARSNTARLIIAASYLI